MDRPINPSLKELSKRLIEELHEPFTNASRWAIAEEFLQEAYDLGRVHIEKSSQASGGVPHE